jgi:DNA-binding HxlR family transcriptional regulator
MSTEVEPAVRILRPVAAPRLAPAPGAPKRSVATAKPPASQPHGARARTPIELTVEVLRGPFRPLIVWGLFWGARPFSELMRHVPDVTKRALRRELVEMERIGLLVRDVRPDSNRRACYALSPFGETLRPVVGAMYEWGLLCADSRRSPEDRLRVRTGA